MRAVWVLGVAQLGCRALLGIEDPVRDVPDDAPNAPIDEAIDAAAIACQIASDPLSADRGRVGGMGGNITAPPLACPVGQHPIGVAVRVSDNVTTFGYRSTHGIVITCASVAIDVTGGPVVGPPTTIQLDGTGLNGWAPSTLTATTACREGWILSGLSASTSGDGMRFADVSIQCTEISSTGKQLSTETIAVAGSLSEPQGKTSAMCSSNEVIAQLPNHTGSGLDSLNVFCARVGCAP